MDCSLFWDIALSILSFVLTVISVGIALSTLKQNNRMIEETTRPNLSLIILNDNGVEFIIKNTGQSDAIIETITHNMNFDFCSKHGYYPFKKCEGSVIAPGQYLGYIVEYDGFCDNNEDEVTVAIKYKSAIGKKYTLNQSYSIIALRNQTYGETDVDENNASIIEAKNIQKIYKLLRTR